MYGIPGLTQNAMQVQRLLALQRLQQQQQQQLLLLQRSVALMQPLQVSSSLVMTSLPPIVSSQPLAIADLKPSVQDVFWRLVREYSHPYRLAYEEKEKSKAQSIVKTIYDSIMREGAPTGDLVKELPSRDRLEKLIRSSLDLGISRARASEETKAQQELDGKPKASSKASVEASANNDSGITTPQDVGVGRTEIPEGWTISLSAKRAYRQAVEEAQKNNVDHHQQIILKLNQHQEYLRQIHLGAASQNGYPVMNRQGTPFLQHRYIEHNEQKRQCMQVIAVLEQRQSEARNLLNRQSLDPVTRSKIANGLLERQCVIDSQSVRLGALIKCEKDLSARTNNALKPLSGKSKVHASGTTPITPKEDKGSSQGGTIGKPSGKESSRFKGQLKKTELKSVRAKETKLKRVCKEQINLHKGPVTESIHNTGSHEGQKTTNLSESKPSADGECSVQHTLPIPLSTLSSTPPSLCLQKATIKASDCNGYTTKLTSPERCNRKNIATHNLPGDIIKDEFDFDAILHHKGPSQWMQDRKSRRQQINKKTEPPEDTNVRRKRKRLVAESPETIIGKDDELTATKAEKKPSALKKTKHKKKKKRKPTPRFNRIEGVLRPDVATSSLLVDVGNNGDNNPSSGMMRISHTAPLQKKTHKTTIDQKRRKKKRKKHSKMKKMAENPQPLLPKKRTSISVPASKDGQKVPGSDGPIPDYLPSSVQKALKHLAPHNTPGNITAGDNAFILDTALSCCASRVQTRRRKRR